MRCLESIETVCKVRLWFWSNTNLHFRIRCGLLPASRSPQRRRQCNFEPTKRSSTRNRSHPSLRRRGRAYFERTSSRQSLAIGSTRRQPLVSIMGILDAAPKRYVGASIDCVFSQLSYAKEHTNTIQSPVYTLLETPQSPPDLQAKLFLTDDPALVVLYSQLRQKTLQTLRGASKVTPKVEWAFVLHNARLYDRMGCDLLALGLGKLPHSFAYPLSFEFED